MKNDDSDLEYLWTDIRETLREENARPFDEDDLES